MRVHQLKTVQPFFDSVASGCKPLELRKNDRDYRRGDVLVLREWNPETEKYSAREVMRRVSYVLQDDRWLQPGIAALGLADDLDTDERRCVFKRIGSIAERFQKDNDFAAKPIEPLAHCAAHKDGDCTDAGCPQNRDGEPINTGRHCPLDTQDEDDA